MLAFLAAVLISPPLLIRTAQVDISPPEPLPLGGYTARHGRVMDEGGDPLYARCVEFQQGETRIAIVAVEMLTVPESLYREVSSRIPKGVHLWLQATHTHCAPDSQMLNDRMTFSIPGIATYRRRWLKWYADKIASVVALAEKAKPARPAKLEARVVDVDANRARREGGKPDKRAVFVRSPDPVFAFYTAHPVIYDADENATRGDWIGLFAKKFGCLTLNGAIGDVSPRADGATAKARMEDFFSRFDRALGGAKPKWTTIWKPGDRLGWATEPIPLDPPKPHATFAKENGIPEALAQTLVDKFAPPSAGVVAIRLGSLALVGVPGEPTSLLGRQIQAGSKETVLVCSHVDGWMGYILDPRDYDRGGYEATLSFYGRNEGEKVVAAAKKALAEVIRARPRTRR